jgi:hypothetical protein
MVETDFDILIPTSQVEKILVHLKNRFLQLQQLFLWVNLLAALLLTEAFWRISFF